MPMDRFRSMITLAVRMARSSNADALMLLVEGPTNFERLKEAVGDVPLLLASESASYLEGAAAFNLRSIKLPQSEGPVQEKLTQALLESVADDLLAPGADVVAVYSGFEAGKLDSVSLIHLDEHLKRLTSSDLRQLETRVPLDTLKSVVDLAVEIGREGREGKPVGTMFVVGNTKKVLTMCHAIGFDPVKGYHRDERMLSDPRVREGIKEIAQMDGAFIVTPDGVVQAAAQYVDASAAGITLSKGLGARHWAAAAVSRASDALAVTVSESSGTVRIFQNGEVMLRIEPLQRPMKWKGFEDEPEAASGA
ncbi:MAG: diadenylate cyclase [Planctomycetia bacterium]|nr:diadenylate cyclase [Planctomycetia bacterium]